MFFSKIKSLLKHDYGGRYLALVLKEIIEEDNSITNQIWREGKKIKKDSFYVQTEWSFPDRPRIADLAVISKIDGRALALAEIKYEDEKKDDNKYQLNDYLDYCCNNNINFTYLTKNLPPVSDLKIVNNNYLSYASLVHRIERKKNTSYFSKLLCEFIREEGYVFQKKIDKDALLLLMVNSLSFPNRHGLGKLNTLKRITKDVPRTFETILNNTSVIGTMFYEGIAFNSFHKRPTLEYKFHPHINIKKSQSRLSILEEKNEETITRLEKDEIEFGEFNSYAYLKFKGGDRWLYITFGYSYQLEKGKDKSKALQSKLFAEINGEQVEYDYEETKIKIELNEEKTYSTILELILKILSRSIKNKNNNPLHIQKHHMNRLCREIKKKI